MKNMVSYESHVVIKLAAVLCAFMLCCYSQVSICMAQSRGVQGIVADPRGDVELTVCSQNLKNFAITQTQLNAEAKGREISFSEKEAALTSRFIEAGCDIVGVQEANGQTDEVARQSLEHLAKLWQKRTGRVFDVRVGMINENVQRVGVIVAKDRAEILNLISYRKVLLPRIDDNQKPRQFSRAPIEVQLSVKGRGESQPKNVSILNFHFKSKSASMGDPAGLEWETARMEMAEAIRRIANERYKGSFETGDVPLIVMGDRNSNFDSASAKILEGTYILQDFKNKAACRLSKRGVPLCQAGTVRPQTLFSALTLDPQTKLMPGTFVYKKTYSWIDEILLPQANLPMARLNATQEGDYDSGVVSKWPKASDHSLVYVRLNW